MILTRVGSNAPEVLKALREITGLGLADAEALAEGAPSVLRSGLSFDAALQLANRLTAAGADVDLRVD
ncbi:MAG: ribosomal protein L7/L12 [Planctomycetota bacterium]